MITHTTQPTVQPLRDAALWPGTGSPVQLLAAITDWLREYHNRKTRHTYAEGIGLPTSETELRTALRQAELDAESAGADRANVVAWLEQLRGYTDALGVTDRLRPDPGTGSGRRPPPGRPGRLRQLHWFRWCARHNVDPLKATTTMVKAWQDDLVIAGAAAATRDRMLGTVKSLYDFLATEGLVEANPAAINRKRLGLRKTQRRASPTITLTPVQVVALYDTAGRRRRGVSEQECLRAQAILGMFLLGLRVSEVCALDRSDLHVNRGRRALWIHGKGDVPRVVYLSELADTALTAYLQNRDQRQLTHPGGAPTANPLIVASTGRRMTRQDVWNRLRRLAKAAGLEELEDRMHPHMLRHFYVTAGIEAGSDRAHVQHDVGHASGDTTDDVYNAAPRAPERSAVDAVNNAVTAARGMMAP